MKLVKSSLWFELEKPLAEPDVIWKEGVYIIERLEITETFGQHKQITWFGQNFNWNKVGEFNWTKLRGNEVVIFEKGHEPIYETLYQELLKEKK